MISGSSIQTGTRCNRPMSKCPKTPTTSAGSVDASGMMRNLRSMKLATISVVYSVSMVVLLTTIGVVFFRETLTASEMIGLAMAIGSLILLVRFA